MTTVVTTPTGKIGSRVVRVLVQAGIRPRVLLREPNNLDGATRELVDVHRCDQGDAEAVVRATRGAERLLWINPPDSDDDPVAGHARMGANAARVVTENGIGRTVFVSSIGAEKGSGVGEIDGLARTERLLNETGASVSHLRCGYFFTNLLAQAEEIRAGVLRTPWPLDFPMAWVDPRDIGEVAAARLLSDDWSGQRVRAVHGPEDLTFSRVAGVLGEVLGHTVVPERISDDRLRASLSAAGLSDRRIEGIVGMSAGMRENFTPEQKRDLVTTTPTTLGAWAFANLRPRP
ncbi:NmrA family transcriptional regulator [Actinopolyspora erythraea]|uniref:NmrA family transcriptional regulator n=1 Tax=Actinopolyspora erythraea TaxID=414996 RepID=A0A099DBE6_9ACTN|nr:NAD(P)H-binding protein [Actinopolyspora erythraea]ASU80595.1 NmrA family transcriptional regulator [Actinopolyspora erythraea]KGI82725.1 NmrA family transcriptional regulator [Actinopolyspora erythraea]